MLLRTRRRHEAAVAGIPGDEVAEDPVVISYCEGPKCAGKVSAALKVYALLATSAD